MKKIPEDLTTFLLRFSFFGFNWSLYLENSDSGLLTESKIEENLEKTKLIEIDDLYSIFEQNTQINQIICNKFSKLPEIYAKFKSSQVKSIFGINLK